MNNNRRKFLSMATILVFTTMVVFTSCKKTSVGNYGVSSGNSGSVSLASSLSSELVSNLSAAGLTAAQSQALASGALSGAIGVSASLFSNLGSLSSALLTSADATDYKKLGPRVLTEALNRIKNLGTGVEPISSNKYAAIVGAITGSLIQSMKNDSSLTKEQKQKMIKALVKSTIKGLNAANLTGASLKNNILKQVTSQAVGKLDDVGFSAADIKTSIQFVTSGATSALGDMGASTTADLNTMLTLINSAAVGSLDDTGMSTADRAAALQYVTAGSIEALDDFTFAVAGGFSATDMANAAKNISSAATAALYDAGIPMSDMTAALKALSAGAVAGLSNMGSCSITCLDFDGTTAISCFSKVDCAAVSGTWTQNSAFGSTSAIQQLAINNITAGSIGSIDSYPGASTADIAGATKWVMAGTTQGMGTALAGATSADKMKFIQSATQAAVGAFGAAGLSSTYIQSASAAMKSAIYDNFAGATTADLQTIQSGVNSGFANIQGVSDWPTGCFVHANSATCLADTGNGCGWQVDPANPAMGVCLEAATQGAAATAAATDCFSFSTLAACESQLQPNGNKVCAYTAGIGCDFFDPYSAGMASNTGFVSCSQRMDQPSCQNAACSWDSFSSICLDPPPPSGCDLQLTSATCGSSYGCGWDVGISKCITAACPLAGAGGAGGVFPGCTCAAGKIYAAETNTCQDQVASDCSFIVDQAVCTNGANSATCTWDNVALTCSGGAVTQSCSSASFNTQATCDSNGAFFGCAWNGTSCVGGIDIVIKDAIFNIYEAGGNGNILLRLLQPSASPVTASFTWSGTATNGSDYTVSSSTVTIPAGSTSAIVTITGIADNSWFEANETIAYNVIVTGAVLIASSSDYFTLIDNVTPPTINVFNAGPATLIEGGASGQIVAQLVTGALQNNAIITLGFSGVATSADYSASATQIIIPAGQTFGSITISGLADSTTEGIESLNIDVLSIVGAQPAGGSTAAMSMALQINEPATSGCGLNSVESTCNTDATGCQWSGTGNPSDPSPMCFPTICRSHATSTTCGTDTANSCQWITQTDINNVGGTATTGLVGPTCIMGGGGGGGGGIVCTGASSPDASCTAIAVNVVLPNAASLMAKTGRIMVFSSSDTEVISSIYCGNTCSATHQGKGSRPWVPGQTNYTIYLQTTGSTTLASNLNVGACNGEGKPGCSYNVELRSKSTGQNMYVHSASPTFLTSASTNGNFVTIPPAFDGNVGTASSSDWNDNSCGQLNPTQGACVSDPYCRWYGAPANKCVGDCFSYGFDSAACGVASSSTSSANFVCTFAGSCQNGNTGCFGGAPNGTCDIGNGETSVNCGSDCSCGDAFCDNYEGPNGTCVTDCPTSCTVADAISCGNITGCNWYVGSASCGMTGTCTDGIKNQDETTIDTGGVCGAGGPNGVCAGLGTSGACNPTGTCGWNTAAGPGACYLCSSWTTSISCPAGCTWSLGIGPCQ